MILFSVRRPATIAQGEHETLPMVARGSLKPHECFPISVLRNAKLTKNIAKYKHNFGIMLFLL